MEASMAAGREHPSRILLVVTAAGRNASLDAEVHIGEGTPGEVVVIRMRGAVAAHPASVIRPLLLPDSPVVIWWPGKAPNNRPDDELAQLAMRRMTDAAASPRPLAALKARARDYTPGDSDLSWTRLTPWRALLAAALDQYPAKIKSVVVESERGNPSADLLAAWLHSRLTDRGCPQDQQRARTHRGADGHRSRAISRSLGPMACSPPTPYRASRNDSSL